ncbi:PhnD/SsuA/transferrin family substrate-binding protein [Chondrinema litorale]|uniref:PhnD/SsuA/transferrin family substrate-binding protein n=1 Tax=Chondrinema litorale TaxID=2994555 RepID=UPI002542C67D|nr:PhnD/SsuA/transferrin family substrate-binding protein [Chondrinema litorale]UZR98354.1 PhnD/SsuA/transferrin family substrate-binding protein [Chondrinema litorale]
MKSNYSTIFWSLILSLFLMVSQNSWASKEKNKDHIKILIDKEVNENLSNLIEYLENNLDIEVEIVSFSTLKELFAIINKGDFDIIYNTPFFYTLARTQSDNIEPFMSFADSAGNPGVYYSCFIRSEKSDVQSLDQLIEQSHDYEFIFASSSSTSGHLLPRMQLASMGITLPEMFFNSVNYSNGHSAVKQEVIESAQKIGACACEESGVNMEGLKTLFRSPPILHKFYAANKSFDKKLRAKIQHALEKMHENPSDTTYQKLMASHDDAKSKRMVSITEEPLKPMLESIKDIKDLVFFISLYEEKFKVQQQKLAEGNAILKDQESKMEAQKAILDKQLIQIENQSVLLYLSVLFIVLALVSAGIFYNNYRQKKKLNDSLAEKNNEIASQNFELQQQKEEMEAQQEFIAERVKELEYKNQLIHSSINSAKTIQRAVFPEKLDATDLIEEFFILNKPKDTVSGDFHWSSRVEDTLWLVAADCTGHGVPGAFMTLLGNSLLDKLININKIESPAEVLSELDLELKKLLGHSDKGKHSGMDMVIMKFTKIDEYLVQMVFCGAKNNLYIIKPDGAFVELKGDRVSISGNLISNKGFSDQIEHLPKGSILLTGSDGYQDQNDIHRKGFGKKRLKQFFKDNSEKSPSELKDIFEGKLKEHMQGTEQRDDILLMCAKI